ncbi:MAG: hypothetical protein K2X81_08530 [Candidatus Obscuribacterales bacterium]|nr:hypothetical protein [Candidatus Obscuribacterales bacterium]
MIAAQQLSALAASPVFDQAVQQYKARHYSSAISGFQTVLKSNPSDQMSHYYMALCYQGTNQITQARQEYEWVTRSPGNAQIRNYAFAGLSNLGKYSSTFGSSRPVSNIGQSFAPAGQKLSRRLKVLEFYTDW